MFQNIQWKLEPGNKGILSPGPWLWLRAIIWAALLFIAVLFLFFASQSMGQWLHLPSQSSYATALGVPLISFWVYAIAVRKGEKRIAQEVLPDHSTMRDLILGAAIGTCMITATLGLLWMLGSYHVDLHHWGNWYDSFIAALLKEIKERVRTAQLRASFAVSRELVLLYWSIGRDILVRQNSEGWGAKVIERLA